MPLTLEYKGYLARIEVDEDGGLTFVRNVAQPNEPTDPPARFVERRTSIVIRECKLTPFSA
jgi:hypothetical protein